MKAKQKPSKNKESALVSAEEFETAMAKYVAAEQREFHIKQEIETEINELIGRYSEELDNLAKFRQQSFEIAHTYCLKNKEALFARRRSVATPQGIAGFRLGTPRLKVLNGGSWDRILELLKDKLPAYIRTIEEPAKDMLLSDRNKVEVAPLLRDIGIQVVQDELFYIETKTTA